MIALVLRRYTAMHDGGDTEKYPGEVDRIRSWFSIIAPRLAEQRHRLPPGNGDFLLLLRELCPMSLRRLAP